MKKMLTLLLLLSALPVQAQSHNFVNTLNTITKDGYLDKQDIAYLKSIYPKIKDPTDKALGEAILSDLSNGQYSRFNLFFHKYNLEKKSYTFKFFVVPTYYENETISQRQASQVLSLISQKDSLVNTREDGNRCGASALLAAHYVLHGSFDQAFKYLGVSSSGSLTYKKIHMAQEKLYLKANTDGINGLSEIIEYRPQADGSVKVSIIPGEIGNAAKAIGLQIAPLKIKNKEDLLDRQKVIVDLWKKYPNVPLLVGVHLDQKTGIVYPPVRNKRDVNHAVLVFRQKPYIYLYNSGDLDNGIGNAIMKLSANDFRNFVIRTQGLVNVVLPQ